MKIIIAGGGRIGFSVAERLAAEGHDITIIETDEDQIENISNALDVICIQGSATDSEVLTEAGAKNADLLLAVTEYDESNMICGISARKLGTKHVIARIRDPQYMGKTEFLREALGLNVVVNPELECAKEIARILRFPGASRVDSFSKGNVEIVEHQIKAGSRFDGVQLKEIPALSGAKILVSLVERGDEARIPNGDFKLAAGDWLSITGIPSELRKFFTSDGAYIKPAKTAMIMGGGRISVYLARMLGESGIKVSVIEMNRKRCEELSDHIPETTIICGDATMDHVLLEEGIQSVDAFIALTDEDGDNIITSLYAKSVGVEKIITKVNREHFSELMLSSGLDSVISPKETVVDQITRYVRAMNNSMGSSMETLYKLADGQAEALEFKVTKESQCIGKPLKELPVKEGVLIAALIRGNKSIIPDGLTVIQEDDHAIVTAFAGTIKQLDDILMES